MVGIQSTFPVWHVCPYSGEAIVATAVEGSLRIYLYLHLHKAYFYVVNVSLFCIILWNFIIVRRKNSLSVKNISTVMAVS